MKLTLFFTFDVSLKTWAETGLLQREIHLFQELQKHGIEVQFLTYGDSSDRNWEAELSGIKLIPVYERFPRPCSKVLRLFQSVLIPWSFRKELKTSECFKTNQIWGGWVAVLSKWICRKPLLVRCGYDFFDFSRKKGRPLAFRSLAFVTSWLTYRASDAVHVATTEDRDIVKQVFGVPNFKIKVRPNWINTKKFTYAPSPQATQLLAVGRLTNQKNLSLLLRALAGMEIGLDVIGEGELYDDLVSEARSLGVNVQFLGSLPNDQLPVLYQSHSVYVLCSRFEGNPKTLLEAMSCGCAVIGTNVPGIRDVISHEHSGLLVEESIRALRTAILRLWEDPELRFRLGQRARQQVEEQNSLESSVQKELQIYGKLVQNF